MYQFDHKAKSILFTGGIGDVLALESHFTVVKETLKTIYWASRNRQYLQPLFEQVYPDLEHINLVDDKQVWPNFWGFMSLEDVCSRLPAFDHSKKREELEEQLQDVADWSIGIIFPLFGIIPFQGSSFLKHKLADISQFKLPERYAVIQAYTGLNRPTQRNIRHYRQADWDRTRAWLDERDLPGVVINLGVEAVPNGYFDLSNGTTLAEAIEVIKGAKAYIGIDSFSSVLASQLFPDEMLQIMWRNTHLWTERRAYYAPKTEFEFLVAG